MSRRARGIPRARPEPTSSHLRAQRAAQNWPGSHRVFQDGPSERPAPARWPFPAPAEPAGALVELGEENPLLQRRRPALHSWPTGNFLAHLTAGQWTAAGRGYSRAWWPPPQRTAIALSNGDKIIKHSRVEGIRSLRACPLPMRKFGLGDFRCLDTPGLNRIKSHKIKILSLDAKLLPVSFRQIQC